MPNIKSAIKRVKITNIKTQQNRSIKTNIKSVIKKFDTAITDGNLDNARALYPFVIKKIDQATSKGVYHKNTANRKKAKLAIKLQGAQAQQ